SHLTPPLLPLFFFNDPPTPEPYPLSLHDALPIWDLPRLAPDGRRERAHPGRGVRGAPDHHRQGGAAARGVDRGGVRHRRRELQRSEEHTSELQSLTNLVCRLLLEKKKHKPSHSRT